MCKIQAATLNSKECFSLINPPLAPCRQTKLASRLASKHSGAFGNLKSLESH